MKTILRIMIAASLLGPAVPSLAEVVAVVGANSPAGAMTKDEVAQIFLGKSTAMTPIDLPDGVPSRNEFYKKVTDKEASQVKALWSKLVFTGKAKLPMSVAGNAEVKKAVAADPKAIGYIEKSALDATVKVVLSAP